MTYRSAKLVAPADPSPPLWQRIVARVAPKLFGAHNWQWYRRAVGGRWARICVAITDGRGEPVFEWQRVKSCPASWDYESITKVGAMLLLGIDGPARHNDTIGGHGARCTCEDWP